MKKILYSLLIISILFFTILMGKTYAVALDNVDISVDKTIVEPESEVTLKITFGKQLGAYTFDIAYDNNLLEYVRTDGGSANDNGTRVRVVYYDSTGGTNPKESMSITFKAKKGITTSNPTDLSVTAEGLANADASENYDDINVALVKNIVVEPKYEDYKFELNYTGNPTINEEKEMKLSLISNMGRYYDKARIIAEVKSSNGGNVKILGTDSSSIEHDLINSGWGDPNGYKIGGKVNQELNLRGLFDKKGEYIVTFKLIDRSNSDKVITEKDFTITVDEKNQDSNNNTQNGNNTTAPNGGNNTQNNNNGVNTIPSNSINQNVNTNTEKLPNNLPKTGKNLYIPILVILMFILSTAFYIKLRNNKEK